MSRMRVTAAAALGGALVVVAPSSGRDHSPRPAAVRTAVVHVGATPVGRPFGPSFVGLGVEAATLREGELAPGRPVLSRLLGNLGAGSLRVGGNSLDRPPAGSDQLARALPGMFALLRPLGWSALVGLDLGRFSPAAAGHEAATAVRLGGHALAAVAFGNEPDLFADVRPGVPAVRPSGYGVGRYLREWRACARAAPHVPLAGPEVFDTRLGRRMLSALVASEGLRLHLATAHYYPLSRSVADPASPQHADLGHLLAFTTRVRESAALRALVHAAGRIPLRLDEANSVVGFGRHGVSDTLAGALWTVDFLMRAARAGVVGVNLEAGLDRCGSYTPICARSAADARADRLRVQPNYYALLLVHRAAAGRLLPVRSSGNRQLTAYATADGGRVRIVLDNLGAAPVRVRIVLPAAGPAVVVRLEGSGLADTGGTTLGGRAVAPEGLWRPGHREALALAPSGTGSLVLGGASAALVTIMQGPG